MQFYLKYSKEKIKLADKPFAGGGEGNLYKIISPKLLRNYVAKIYHPEKLNTQREEKIQYLYKTPPKGLEEGQHPAFIWVKDILYDANKEFRGFIMPFIKGEKLDILSYAKLPKHLGDEWKRFDLRDPKAFELRLRICFNLAAAIYHIHATQHYVVVDLKPENVIIQANGLVSLVDMDSVEVVENGQVIFPAPVATPEYTAPEHYRNETRSHQLDGIDTHWDMFALPIIFYKLLFGIHPHTASAKAPYDNAVSLHEKIQHGLFVHHPSKKDLFHVIPPPHQAFEKKLPEDLQKLFIQTFVAGHSKPELRPIAEDWCMALLHSFGDEKMILHFQNLFRRSGYRNKSLRQPSIVTTIPTIAIKEQELLSNDYHKILSWTPPSPTPQLPKKPVKLDLSLNKINVNLLSIITTIVGIYILAALSGTFSKWIFSTLWEQSTLVTTVLLQLLLLIPLIIMPLLLTGIRYTFNNKVRAWRRLKRISNKVLNSFEKEKAEFLALKNSLKTSIKDTFNLSDLKTKEAQLQSEFKAWLKEQDEQFELIQKKEWDASNKLLEEYLEKACQHDYYKGPPVESFKELKYHIQKQKPKVISKITIPENRVKLLKIESVKADIESKEKQLDLEKAAFINKVDLELQLLDKEQSQEILDLDKKLETVASLGLSYREHFKYITLDIIEIIKKFQNLGFSSMLQVERIDEVAKRVHLKDGSIIEIFEIAGGSSLALSSMFRVWETKTRILERDINDEKLRLKKKYENIFEETMLRKEEKLAYFGTLKMELEEDAIEAYLIEEVNSETKGYKELVQHTQSVEQKHHADLKKLLGSFEKQYQYLLDNCQSESEKKQLELDRILAVMEEKVKGKISLTGLDKLSKEGLLSIKKLEKVAEEAENAEENYLKYAP